MSGELFIVSTPIGNLKDISYRVKDALSRSSLILAEDTRVSGKLLHHLGIKTPMMSCHDFNEEKRFSVLEEAAAESSIISLVSDAGTPLVSDPGYQLVRKAIELGLKVTPIPGPSALLAALVGSGLPCERFIFEAFLPEKVSERKRRLEFYRHETRTAVFYIAPSNLNSILKEILEICGGDRTACLARELTKLHEEFIRLNLSQLCRYVENHELKGEFVLVLGGAPEGQEKRRSPEDVERQLRDLLSCGGRLKEIAGILAPEVGWSSSELYKLGLAIKEARDKQA